MILFRADGNQTIGTGHIMRCLSIANSARLSGYECCFVLASDDMQSVVENNGFKTVVLNTEYTDLESESDKLQNVIKTFSADVMILDSYYVTEKYMTDIRNLVKLAYIDDLYAFPYPTDMLINYNIYADKERYDILYHKSSIKPKKFFLGPQYAPLRNEFSKTGNKIIKDKAENVLILTGGTDNFGISLNIADYIVTNNISDLNFHFVLGKFNENIVKLKEYESKYANIYLHINVTNMSELMNNSDIAISAAGTTLYELCACGVPTITYILADNQIDGSHAFAEKGLMASAGDIRSNLNYPEMLMNEVLNLKDDFSRRKLLSENMQKTVNSNGACEIIHSIT